MDFFKPIIMTILFGVIVCTALISLGAHAPSVLLGGFSVVILSMGRAIYDHFSKRIQRKMSPFL